jgi:hypothetical protein
MIYLGHQSRRMRQMGQVKCVEGRIGAYRFWVGKPGRKRPFGRRRHRWKGNIKMNVQEVG